MKKMFLFAALCAVALSSCSKRESAPDHGKLIFEVSTVNSLQVRSAIYSQEAVHEVERMNIYAFQKSGLDYVYFQTFTFPTWIKGSSFQRFEVPTADMLPAGDYRFLGVGQDLTDNFTLPTVAGLNYNDFIVTIASAGLETEIFAGSKDATITSTGMRVPISMARQVAGVLGYFKNVPADIGGTTVKYLRLSVSNSNLGVNLTTGFGSSPTAASYNIIDVDLSGQTVNTDGAYVGNDLTANGVVKADNSQLNGAFLIPVNNITLTLGLYDENGVMLKTWNVLDASATSFNIVANHFYSLGTKIAKTTTTGTPDDPTPDAPIDLMTDQSITVTISPEWSAIHNLVIN